MAASSPSPSYSRVHPKLPAGAAGHARSRPQVPASELPPGVCSTALVRCEWLVQRATGARVCQWHGDELTKHWGPGCQVKRCPDCERDGAPRRSDEG